MSVYFDRSNESINFIDMLFQINILNRILKFKIVHTLFFTVSSVNIVGVNRCNNSYEYKLF